MIRHPRVQSLVEAAYLNTSQPFGRWMCKHHVPVVAQFAQKLSQRFEAEEDLAVAGALLHDFGDAFVHRHDERHEEVSNHEARKILEQAGYGNVEIKVILEEIIAPHSCKDGHVPQTLEGKILATADALAHLTTDFYLQFGWMHLPDNKTYLEYLAWVQGKLRRDFEDKIFFEEVRREVKPRYDALCEVFGRPPNTAHL